MDEPTSIRIVVADDHPLFREGVANTLAAQPGFTIVGQAADGEEAVRQVQEHLPDVVLLDVAMPGGNGLTAAREIAGACPATSVIMLTVSEDDDDLLAAFKAGARGYVLKGVSARKLVDVVKRVAHGEVYVSPSLATGILVDLSRGGTVDPLEELSAREKQILELVGEGLTNKEIGNRLRLAEKTIKHYMTNVLQKLQVRSRVEAALVAERRRRRDEP